MLHRSRRATHCVAFALALAAFPARAELVYDNFGNNLVAFVSLTKEYGDEITFAGSARTLKSMTFQVVGEKDLPETARVLFRIYRNNGPIPPPPEPAIPGPGELLYQSDEIAIHAGTQSLRIVDVAIPVPNSVIWTVEFQNVGDLAGERAGLQVYHPPIVGRSFKDYWVHDPDRFRLYLLESGTPASFGARFEADPDPPVTLIALPNAQGQNLVQVTGPIGSEQIIEVSTDRAAWRTLGSVNLATNASGSLLDAEIGSEAKQYRARPSPYPGQTVILQGITRKPDGSTVVTLAGPAGSEQLLEISDNQASWRPVEIIRFSTPTATYEDPTAAASVVRFYRTSRPASGGPLYLIRSITANPDGTVTLACTGLPSLKALNVEVSTDFIDWTSIGTLRFDTTEAEFVDSSPPATGVRFYRLKY